jgi:hypothetical protein
MMLSTVSSSREPEGASGFPGEDFWPEVVVTKKTVTTAVASARVGRRMKIVPGKL